MSEAQDTPPSTSPTATPPGHMAGDSRVATGEPRQLVRPAVLIKAFVAMALLGIGGWVCFGHYDGAGWLHSLTVPPMVPASGLVLYNGQPLAGAQISTQPVGRRIRGAIGWTGEDGRFTLQTDLNGYVPGAYAGEHQVVVTQFQTMNAPMQPPLLTPEVYSKFATSPLRIQISRSEGENAFTLNLEGAPPPNRFGNGGGRPPLSPPPIGNAESREKEAAPTASAESQATPTK